MSSCPDCIFEIHQLWQSGFSRVYSNCCCSCSFEPEIIKIGLSSYKMYSNNIVNFQESMTILNACTIKVWKLIECTTYVKEELCICLSKYVYVCVFVCIYVKYTSIIPIKLMALFTVDYLFCRGSKCYFLTLLPRISVVPVYCEV